MVPSYHLFSLQQRPVFSAIRCFWYQVCISIKPCFQAITLIFLVKVLRHKISSCCQVEKKLYWKQEMVIHEKYEMPHFLSRYITTLNGKVDLILGMVQIIGCMQEANLLLKILRSLMPFSKTTLSTLRISLTTLM